MAVPLLQPGDTVLLGPGQRQEVELQIGDDYVVLSDGSLASTLQLRLLMVRPVHLAIFLFNTHGPEGVHRFKCDRSYNQQVSYLRDEVLTKHFSLLKTLTCCGAIDYSWKDEFEHRGSAGLDLVAEEVLRHLERLLDLYREPFQM